MAFVRVFVRAFVRVFVLKPSVIIPDKSFDDRMKTCEY